MEQKGQRCKRNIAIAGLTAAGKTTHARITQAEFGFRYVSASTLLLEKAGFKGEPPRDFWLSANGQELSQKIIDLGIDEALRETEDTCDETIFDCRSLPWLTRNRILSIWLESSLDSRVWKCMISHGKADQSVIDDIRKEIVLKDERDRKNLLTRFGFDLFRDYEVMDIIIDLTGFITAPLAEASWRSIQITQEIISMIVGLYLTEDDFYRLRLRALRESSGSVIFPHFSRDFIRLLNG